MFFDCLVTNNSLSAYKSIALSSGQQQDYCHLLTVYEKDFRQFPGSENLAKAFVVLTDNKDAQIALLNNHFNSERAICQNHQRNDRLHHETEFIKNYREQTEIRIAQEKSLIVDLVSEKEIATEESYQKIEEYKKTYQQILENRQEEIAKKIIESQESIAHAEQEKSELLIYYNSLNKG